MGDSEKLVFSKAVSQLDSISAMPRVRRAHMSSRHYARVLVENPEDASEKDLEDGMKILFEFVDIEKIIDSQGRIS